MLLKTMVAFSVPALLLAAQATTTNLVMTSHDFILAGGSSFLKDPNAPTGIYLRSGSPGQSSVASFPNDMVLAPGSTVKEISFAYRYVTGYGDAGTGHGSNISLSISDELLQVAGTVVYNSPHYTDYAYNHDKSNYSLPVYVHLSGLSIPASAAFKSRLQLAFSNNDRNLQVLIPLSVNVTCEGVDKCFVPPPVQPTPAPLPPTPAPPATHTPWKSIGPSNIGDDINNGGEAGTIHGAASPSSNPKVMYMGGNNNAAASGVLKSVDGGKHWSKVNTGLWDTRILDVFIVDDKEDHVLVGTFSGVFETLDGGQNWNSVDQTRGWGVANSFMNGTINGMKYIFVGTTAGLGNVPVRDTPLVNETWNLIPSPPGHAAWRTNEVSVADYRDGKLLQNSVVGGCLWVANHGVVHIATIINETAADWDFQLDQPCVSLAMDPNDADHFIVNNATNGAHVYESNDGGGTYHGCLDKRTVLLAIDRQGWFYCGSEGGAFRNINGCVNGEWEAMFIRRTARRTGGVQDKVAHDYQKINIDFAGGVAFGSDQGMFIKNGSALQLISGNGDVNNNIIMHPAIAEAEEAGERCIVTALWDWSPVASWDSGKHWPSWQTADDGSAMNFFGEGGGCFGIGQSKHVLCMHHHNVAYSSRCGKNMSRFVVPHGGSVAPPEFTRKTGSRSEPAGPVYAFMTMGAVPWETSTDKAFTCEGDNFRGDLGVHTSYSCLSHVDIGTEYGWYPDVNVAVWRGASDKHCYLCTLAGNSSAWKFTATKGDVSYALLQQGDKSEEDGDEDEDGDYEDGDGEIWSERKMMKSINKHMEKTRALEWSEDRVIDHPTLGLQLDASADATRYVLKSWNFGANWTWIVLPTFLQDLSTFRADPTNNTVLYGISPECIARSYDQAETWEYCWDAPGLEGSFSDLVIKDSQTMLVMRNGAVPLRTRDGGKSWKLLGSLENIARNGKHAAYSWSGKTLAVSSVVGQTLVWVSKDDGDTWVDESGDYTAMSGGISQWYDNTLYISSLGQGIASKVFPE